MIPDLIFSQEKMNLKSAPQNGEYFCFKGNEDSICEQKISIKKNQTRVIAILVEYVGQCGGQGPFTYPCLNNQCSDGQIEIFFINDKAYHWKNLKYQFFCEMHLIENQK